MQALVNSACYLRTGGIALIQIPTRCGVEKGAFFGQYWALLDLPRHLNFLSRESLAELCDRSGLDLIAFKTPLIDTLWCYYTSSKSYVESAVNLAQRIWRVTSLPR